MKILFVAAEGAPFSKTGGLGDVIGALPKSLVKAGHEVAVILPYYDMVEAKFGNQIEDVLHFEVSVGWRRQYCGIKKTVLNGVTYLVGTAGNVQKASASSTSSEKPELGRGYKDIKDANGKIWTVDTAGIVQ